MSSMLKKKSAFKPKAPARRPAGGPSSQSIDRPESSERLSKTPAPPSVPSVEASRQATPATQEPESVATSSEPSIDPARDRAAAATTAVSDVGARSTPVTSVSASSKTQAPTDKAASSQQSRTPHDAPSATSGPKTTPNVNDAPGPTSRADGAAPGAPATVQVVPSPQPTAASGPQSLGQAVAGTVISQGPSCPTAASRPEILAHAATTALPPVATPAPSIETGASTPTTAATPAPAPIFRRETFQAATPPAEDVISDQPQPSIEAAGEPIIAGPSTAPKTKKPRKRKADATGDENGQPKKRARKKAAAGTEEGGQEGAPKAKKPRKKKAAANADGTGEGDAANEGTTAKKETRQRSVTPEDAENMTVDPTQVKMADLTKDMRIGKKFSRHDELAERARAKRKMYYEKRKAKLNGGVSGDGEASQPGTPAPGGAEAAGDKEDSGNAESGEAGPSSNMAVPQFQVIDGQIVLDSRSLQVDRHARAAEQAGDLEEEEENEFTRHITSATYLKRKLKPNQWTDDETDLFYKALSSFGTDFDTIARMFPGKERRHVKLKFNREERTDKARIDAVLMGQKTTPMMTIDEYKTYTGHEYEATEAIYDEHKKAETEFEARQKQMEEEAAEEARKKREALFGDGSGDKEDEEGAGGAGKKKGKGKAKPKKMSKRAMARAAAEAMAGPEIVEDL